MQGRGFLFHLVTYLLIFVLLLTGILTRFEEGRNIPNDGNRCSILVEAFSLAPLSSLPSSRSSFSLLVRPTEGIIIDDHHSSANATVQYSDVINIVSDAQYMDSETKKRFIESLKKILLDVSKDVGNAQVIDANKSYHIAAHANAENEEQGGIEIEAKVTAGEFQIPTIEGSWEDDGSSFHASGAWQSTPLLMKGAFADEINNLASDGGYPFPSWKKIIELACDGGIEQDDHNTVYEDQYEPDFLHDKNDESECDEEDDKDDGFQNQCDMWVGDSDDDEGDEDADGGFYLWDDDNDCSEDEETSDIPSSRLVQHWWPRQNDPNYYHADVNTNWLDTFEIKQFGPFNDPDSLAALLRVEEEGNLEREVARTLLVNDVDRWFPKLSDWMDRRFNSNKSNGSVLPARWRRDDAQISLSYPKGGIGPHVDNYDVFLIQLDGERTWDVLWEENSRYEEEPVSSKISVRDETDSMLPKSSMNGVRILNITKLQSLQKSRYGKDETRLTRLHLRPGDCLYLPPRVLHCGTAIETTENCMTLSVGCRAPSALELLDGLSGLMKKSATIGTSRTMPFVGSIFPSSTAVQAFHERYTNTQISQDELKSTNDTRASEDNKSTPKISSVPLQSSWLSPQVKNEMKDLVLNAVQTALDDDTNILDPLVGRFVTKSNRLEEEEFGLDGGDGSSLPSFSYPKALGSIVHDEREKEGGESSMGIWANATAVLLEVFDEPKLDQEIHVLRRAEGIAFAWSSVYDNERQIRTFRLYAQGRPPFEVFEVEEMDNPKKPFIPAPNSVVGRLMDRIANGPPLNRTFVVDELQILIDTKQEGTKYTILRLLYDLVEEGLLYGGNVIL